MFHRTEVFFWIFLIATDGLGLTRAANNNKCGFLPNEIYLKRGERKQLVFWTDQNYDNTEAPTTNDTNNEEVDIFLQAVNGGMPKPGVQADDTEQESGPQFISPSTTTTTTTTTTTEEVLEVETTTSFESIETTKAADIDETTADPVTDAPDVETTTTQEEVVPETTVASLTEEEQQHQQDEAGLESVFPTSVDSVSNVEPSIFVSTPIDQNNQENEVLTVIIGETQPITTEPPQEAETTTAAAEIANETTEQQPETTAQPEEKTTAQPEETTVAQAEETTEDAVQEESNDVEENEISDNNNNNIASFAAPGEPLLVDNAILPFTPEETTTTSSKGEEQANTDDAAEESFSNESTTAEPETTTAPVIVEELVPDENKIEEPKETVAETTTEKDVDQTTTAKQEEAEETTVQQNGNSDKENVTEDISSQEYSITTEQAEQETTAVSSQDDETSSDSPRHINEADVQQETTTTAEVLKKVIIPQDDVLNDENIVSEDKSEITTSARVQDDVVDDENVISKDISETTTTVERLIIPQDDVLNVESVVGEDDIESTSTVERLIIPQDEILNDENVVGDDISETTTTATAERLIIPQDDVLNDESVVSEDDVESTSTVERLIIPQDEILKDENVSEDTSETTTTATAERLIIPQDDVLNVESGVSEDDIESTSTAERLIIPQDDALKDENLNNEANKESATTDSKPADGDVSFRQENAAVVETTTENESESSLSDDEDEVKVVKKPYSKLQEENTTESADTKKSLTEVPLANENESEATTVLALEETASSEQSRIAVKQTNADESSKGEETTTTAPVVLPQLKNEETGGEESVSSTTVRVTTTTTVISHQNGEDDNLKSAQPNTYVKNFEETTIAFPESPFIIEANVAENDDLDAPVPNKPENVSDKIFEDTTVAFPDDKPISVEASLAEGEEGETQSKPETGDKIFDDTTIAFPIEEAKPDVPKTDENGLLIETTTGGGPINRVAAVHEAVRKSGRHPVKQAAVDAVEITSNDLEAAVQEKEAKTENSVEEEQTTTVAALDQVEVEITSVNSTESAGGAVEEGSVPFPVNDLLKGIYKFVSSYITPKPAVKQEIVEKESAIENRVQELAEQDEESDEEDEINPIPKSTLIGPQPLNSHTIPRDQLIVEAVDEVHSNSDPFFQMPAPNLRDNVPPEHITDADNSENAILFPKPLKAEPPRTMSPFNSPALKVQEPPKIDPPNSLVPPLPLSAPIERSGLPAGYLSENEIAEDNEISAPPLPFLPGHFLRGAAEQPRPLRPAANRNNDNVATPIGPATKPRLSLGNQVQHSRDPVFIPIPDLLSGVKPGQRTLRRQDPIQEQDPIDSIKSAGRKFIGFLDALPLPLKETFMRRPSQQQQQQQRQRREVDEQQPEEQPETTETTTDSEAINCSWNIKTENGLYLLATFHNLSAPYTVDCEGAYIEVERENNGFEARWCGNRVTKGGSRPHVIFAKNEVRITVFDDGHQDKELPTGFSADVEVIDLFDGEQYSNLRKTNAYSSVKKSVG